MNMLTNPRTGTMRTEANNQFAPRPRRRLTKVAAIAALGVGAFGAMGSSASADRPVEFADSFSFPTVNPCTGEPIEITIHSVIRLHLHEDRFVAHVSRTGSTDDGYVMDRGVETAMSNGRVFRQALSDTFRHENGSTFRAQGVRVENERGVQVDRLDVRCLGR